MVNQTVTAKQYLNQIVRKMGDSSNICPSLIEDTASFFSLHLPLYFYVQLSSFFPPFATGGNDSKCSLDDRPATPQESQQLFLLALSSLPITSSIFCLLQFCVSAQINFAPLMCAIKDVCSCCTPSSSSTTTKLHVINKTQQYIHVHGYCVCYT